MGATKKDRDSEPHYVYFVRCPESGTVRYIGLSKNVEARQHVDGDIAQWKRELSACGLTPAIEVVVGPISFDEAQIVEMRLAFLHAMIYPGRLLNGAVPRLVVKRMKYVSLQWESARTKERRKLRKNPRPTTTAGWSSGSP